MRIVWTTLKCVLGVGLLAVVVWRNWDPPGAHDRGIAYALQQPIHVGPLAVATVICVAAVLLTFVRWYYLVRALDLPFTFANAIRLGFVGYFCNNLLPLGSVGGDFIKAYFLAREQNRRTAAVASVLMDRAIGLWALCWLVALLGTGFWLAGSLTGEARGALETIVFGADLIVGCSLAVWLLLGLLPPHRAERFAGRLTRLPKVGGPLAELWRSVWLYRKRGWSVWLALGLSLVSHAGFVATYYFAARTIEDAGSIPSLTVHFLIIPIGMAVQAGVPLPGGVGGGELAFGWLYALVHYPKAYGVLCSLVYRLISWGLSLVGYLVYLRMRPALRKLDDQPADATTRNGHVAAPELAAAAAGPR